MVIGNSSITWLGTNNQLLITLLAGHFNFANTIMKRKRNPQYQYILFDLDDTLYPKEAGLMKVIGEKIGLYMQQKLGIPADDVAIQKHNHYQKYGTAVRGLIEEYNIDPTDFLDFIHDFNPGDFFGASPPLDRMLHEIPLRKVVFTNSNVSHTERVLNTLQVRHHFELIIDINCLDFKSKPDPWAYNRVLKLLGGIAGGSCIMVEDKPRNLFPAKDLGMTTILVDGESNSIAIDYTVPTIFHIERVLKNLLPMGRY